MIFKGAILFFIFFVFPTGAAHVELERTPGHVAAPLVSKQVTILDKLCCHGYLHTAEMLSWGVRPGSQAMESSPVLCCRFFFLAFQRAAPTASHRGEALIAISSTTKPSSSTTSNAVRIVKSSGKLISMTLFIHLGFSATLTLHFVFMTSLVGDANSFVEGGDIGRIQDWEGSRHGTRKSIQKCMKMMTMKKMMMMMPRN